MKLLLSDCMSDCTPRINRMFVAVGLVLLYLLSGGCSAQDTGMAAPPVSTTLRPAHSTTLSPQYLESTANSVETIQAVTPRPLPSRTSTPTPTPQQTPSAPLYPTSRPTTDTSASADHLTPTIWPTVTRQILSAEIAAELIPCAQRTVEDNLIVVITQQFGLPEKYAPPDLVPLSAYFSSGVTVGIESYVRDILIEPLKLIITDMQAAGLNPSILSGYRSYDEQYLAWKWWNSQQPDRVALLSAPAGHSEHQLGTTVDFGSPALHHLFHVDFANTPEGLWLAENAHRYGFTMSYPDGSYDITGFKFEPWHFRYVGVGMSTELYTTGQTLTEWQLKNIPPPCIP